MAKLEIQGMQHLLDKLQSLGNRAKVVENRALKEGAEILRSEIAARAPRSDSPRQPKPPSQTWRTGEHAADNIKMSGVKQQDGVKIIDVGIQKSDNSHYFYLKFKEWGTSKMAAEPFMEPAVNDKKGEAIDKVKEVILGELGL
ncbi:HK97-gp10 family putative phage morphogenesis protein [Aneurinibacillus thermoaerophilus]|uniref:HK97-gp10 family putative phage morphogenesis protein n=1 Tax=Aneurinibacillus thermoaerophilus TaxID=143495 RepID=UPI002E1CA0A3|nr:HK97 gp10 family phage protein [Aneurinibacillus thermoaerophilus]